MLIKTVYLNLLDIHILLCTNFIGILSGEKLIKFELSFFCSGFYSGLVQTKILFLSNF